MRDGGNGGGRGLYSPTSRRGLEAAWPAVEGSLPQGHSDVPGGKAFPSEPLGLESAKAQQPDLDRRAVPAPRGALGLSKLLPPDLPSRFEELLRRLLKGVWRTGWRIF